MFFIKNSFSKDYPYPFETGRYLVKTGIIIANLTFVCVNFVSKIKQTIIGQFWICAQTVDNFLNIT